MKNIATFTKITLLALTPLIPGCIGAADTLMCSGIPIPHSLILSLANKSIAGKKVDLPLGRTLEIKSITGITSSECRVWLNMNVALDRPILSTKTGTMTLRGDVKVINLKDVCLGNPEVTKLDLSGVGEDLLKSIANKTIPSELCASRF